MYKQNLRALLLPHIRDDDEVTRLVNNSGGKGWSDKAMQELLESRLQDSYVLYINTISDMNETAGKLGKELTLDDTSIQGKLAAQETKNKPTTGQIRTHEQAHEVRIKTN
ncbi:hypothetical protein EJ04DRAFT_522254 [Polyplosphaeria fusca]|uniref:Uncharacterized protein n=1 Tax=Polyplosphaeria fusca TaxID=682080 RepID=A0A9P4V4F1_9PLEO|nr:hypothetical protein EJ04DRAFT_522254 [Polyplosphaeria fusca]